MTDLNLDLYYNFAMLYGEVKGNRKEGRRETHQLLNRGNKCI